MSGMAEFLGKFVGNAGGGFIESTANAIDKFVTTDKERMELQIVLEKVLQARDSEIEGTIRAEAEAKAQIIVAELNQSDKYTKRARPTVIYGGLVVIAWNYCLVPFIFGLVTLFTDVVQTDVLGNLIVTWTPPTMDLPNGFWYAWGGIVSTYAIGRSAEKRGMRNRVTDFMTGSGLGKAKRMIDEIKHKF